jgi:ribosome-associated heat shock protein Hsp15
LFSPGASTATPSALQLGSRFIEIRDETSDACKHVRRENMEHVRIDKWLWAARFFKSRGAATAAVVGGRVHVNGVRVKASKEIRPSDSVEVKIGEVRWTVVVIGVTDKRGPALAAASLYDETPESIAGRERHAAERRLIRPPGADLGPRPTKQARRRIDALRRSLRKRRS